MSKSARLAATISPGGQISQKPVEPFRKNIPLSPSGKSVNGADMIRLAERELMAPLDDEARQLVSNAAQRVSVVTAVSPAP